MANNASIQFIEITQANWASAVAAMPGAPLQANTIYMVYETTAAPAGSPSDMTGGGTTATGAKSYLTDGTGLKYLQMALSAAQIAAIAAAAISGANHFRSTFDASGGLFPATGGSGTSGSVLGGDYWFAGVAGTLGGQPVKQGDLILALTNAPGQTASNWDIIPISQDLSVYALLSGAAFTGAVTGLTRSPGDNTTNFATTAFVATAILNMTTVAMP